MVKKTLVILLVSFFLSPVWAQPEAEDVDEIFSDWAGGPGGAVGVVLNDRLVFSRGYGYANVAKRIPNTPKTVYDLASVSKQFTATSVLLLAEEELLSIHGPLGKYLSGLPDYAADTPLVNLLNMTSGLPDYDDDESVTLDSLVEQLDEGEPSFEPGEKYEYLNMNYALLTYVVEKASGKKLGQVISHGILRPLGMTHTVFLQTPGQKIPNRAVGYVKNEGDWIISKDDVPGVGDGNLFSSVEDLSLWARDLLDGSSLLEDETLELAWTSGKTNNGKKTDYGFGFEIENVQGVARISHTGSWYGTSTYISFYPDLGLSVIVLSNREEEDCATRGEQVEELVLEQM